jgi:hypothetical protein
VNPLHATTRPNTLNVVGSDLESVYGTSTPLGAFVYIEVHPAPMSM